MDLFRQTSFGRAKAIYSGVWCRAVVREICATRRLPDFMGVQGAVPVGAKGRRPGIEAFVMTST